MKPLLTPQNILVVKSMNEYWEEVYKRAGNKNILMNELADLAQVIGAEAILRIVAQYAIQASK